MAIPPAAERARARYGAAVYRSALLCDPSPRPAGQAVVYAFGAIAWDDAPADDRVEALLVAQLPPRRHWRPQGSRPALGLPDAFWALPAGTRLALGLRALRGMPTAVIATALRHTVAETEQLLVAAGRSLIGEHEPITPACERCWRARLAEPTAQRTHLLACATCRDAIPRWEQAERVLAEQLGRNMGSIPLPPAVSEAITSRLGAATKARVASPWQQPAVLQGGMVAAILIGLLVLFWPRATTLRGESTAALTPAALLTRARSSYAAVPPGSGILHRRWRISLGQPQLNFEAEEWVDAQQPARHRMQLVADRQVREWEVGDGQEQLLYFSSIPATFCGVEPGAVDTHANERNRWTIRPQEQAQIRTERWQHGVWALGMHYLDLAAQSDTIRSLGTSGSGANATVTLSATGRAISGTLLLRFDAASQALREVHEIRLNNGQTEDRMPWQLLTSEALSEEAAQEHALLNSYPEDNRPAIIDRTGPIVDRACPLLGTEQTQSLPRILALAGTGALIGLPQMPDGLERALVVGPAVADAGGGFSQRFLQELSNLQVVYVGPAKRLVFYPQPPAEATAATVPAGGWTVHFLPQAMPTIFEAVLEPGAGAGLQAAAGGPGSSVGVFGEGWTREAFLAAVAQARPLRVADWAASPDRFYEPAPLPAASRQHLITIFNAARLRPGATHHRITLSTTRQAPFFAALSDPYHLPATLWPAARREESWTDYGTDGRERRSIHILTDPGGQVLAADWHNEQTRSSYTAASQTVIVQPFAGLPAGGADDIDFLGATEWQWQAENDGLAVADESKSLSALPESIQRSRQGSLYLDNWTRDLGSDSAVVRHTFDSGGNLLRWELLALPDGQGGEPGGAGAGMNVPPAGQLLINSVVVERNEWLVQVPDSTWTWTPPAGTQRASETEVQTYVHNLSDPPRTTHNMAAVAAAMPFPVSDWLPTWSPAQETPVRGDILYRPREAGSSAALVRGTIGNAVGLGIAVDAHYVLDFRSLDVLQGPAPLLRRLLRQTPPSWTSAEQRSVSIRGKPATVWVMRGMTEMSGTNVYFNRWIVVEMNGSLFFIRADVEDSDVEKIIQHLDGLRQVVP